MHKVPVHLDTQDTFLWNLTFRQVMVLFVGGGMSYLVITTNWSTPLTALLCILAGALCSIATLLVAFVRIAHRDLDQWVLVAFLYHSSPRMYAWAAMHEQESEDIPQPVWTEEKGEEEW